MDASGDLEISVRDRSRSLKWGLRLIVFSLHIRSPNIATFPIAPDSPFWLRPSWVSPSTGVIPSDDLRDFPHGSCRIAKL